MREFLRIVSLPARDLMDEFFDNDILKATLSWDGLIGSKLAPRSPNGAVLAMLYRMSEETRGAHCFPSGGINGLIDSLCASAKSSGAEIRCSSRVHRILIQGNAEGLNAIGVQLDGGDRIEAERVISAVDPQRTFHDLVGVEHLDIGFTNRIRRLRCEGFVAELHLALSELPLFDGLENANGRMIIAAGSELSLFYTAQRLTRIQGTAWRILMKININSVLSCLLLSSTLAIAGCGSTGGDDDENVAPASATSPPPPTLAIMLASESRSADDRARDAGRRPVAVLDFLGVKPGMNVVDIIAAGGYYTEILSLAVGPDGNVAAQNPAMMMEVRDGMFAKQLSERLADDRLPNVSRLDKEMTDILAADGPFDVAITALNLHDIYNRYGEEAAVGMMQMVYSTLKPGGVFGVIDHNGMTENDNVALHRMQKADAIRVAEAAGFIVDGDSNILHSAADDMTQLVFAEGLRGNTNRFLLKLRRPET